MRAPIAIGIVLFFAGAGCEEDACEGEPPSFQLDLTADAAGARSLVIELVNGSERKRQAFDLGTELDDGRTSIAIEVEESFLGSITINARTHARPDGEGNVLQEASGSFALAPNGCNRYTLELTDAGAPEDAGVDGGVEEDGGVDEDAGLDRDALPMDDDAGPRDAETACVDGTDPNTIAFYSMEGDLTDATGAHDGTVSGNATFEPGLDTCGQALAFAGTPMVRGTGTISDAPEFDLPEGSIDLWLYVAGLQNRAYGIVSRDSAIAVNGGFTLYVACDGTVVAKLDETYVCSDAPVAARQWSYVGVNFGPPGLELWLNGVRGARTTPVGLFGQGCAETVPCGGTSTAGLSGNDNPWIIGASADASVEGTGSPLALPFRNGMVDAFRISDVRRGF